MLEALQQNYKQDDEINQMIVMIDAILNDKDTLVTKYKNKKEEVYILDHKELRGIKLLMTEDSISFVIEKLLGNMTVPIKKIQVIQHQ